jgi:hypothetical protein
MFALQNLIMQIIYLKPLSALAHNKSNQIASAVIDNVRRLFYQNQPSFYMQLLQL